MMPSLDDEIERLAKLVSVNAEKALNANDRAEQAEAAIAALQEAHARLTADLEHERHEKETVAESGHAMVAYLRKQFALLREEHERVTGKLDIAEALIRDAERRAESAQGTYLSEREKSALLRSQLQGVIAEMEQEVADDEDAAGAGGDVRDVLEAMGRSLVRQQWSTRIASLLEGSPEQKAKTE